MSTLLTKEAILNSKDIEFKDVPIKEWGGSIRLKEMDGTERDVFETEVMKRRKGNTDEVELKGLKIYLLHLCMVNDKGERLFTQEDIFALQKKNARIINDLFTEAQKLNKLKKEDLESAVKN